MKKTAVKLVALAATALVLLSGCAKGNPNVAATVDAQQIGVAQVDAVSKVIAANSPNSPSWGAWRAPVLQAMVVAKLTSAAVAKSGILITDSQRQQVYAADPLFTILAQNPASAEFMRNLADTNVLLSDPQGQQAFSQAISAVEVSVNPAFGVWNPAKAELSGSGSLSQTLS